MVDRVQKEQQKKDSKQKTKDNRKTTEQNKQQTMVTILYIQNVSERLAKTFRKYGISSSSMKPMNTIRQMLVHPKDNLSKEHTDVSISSKSHKIDSLTVIFRRYSWRHLHVKPVLKMAPAVASKYHSK